MVELLPQQPALTVTGRFHQATPIPGDPTYGTWSLYTWKDDGTAQHGAKLTPEHAPWRCLFSALDGMTSSLADDPVTPEEEADAIIACCWRYGSYAHVLSAGELYPPFPEDHSLSRIDDSEMHRINLEFSSGLAAWIAQRASAPSVINKRVRAAAEHLPMPWREKKAMSWISGVDIGPLEARLRNLLRDEPLPEEWSKELTPREEANHLVVWSYRNGPIEDVHGGKWSVGSELPGFKRLYATDVVRVARFARRRLAWHLAARDQLDPTLRSIVLRAKAFGSADGWSVSSETTAVRFPGLPGLGPLDARLRWLAERWPAAYSGAANLG